jgi:recombination protein RecR
MLSKSLQKLVEIFSKFPTVGPRTATRFVFYLTRLSKEEINILIQELIKLKEKVKICPSCFSPYESEGKICDICLNKERDKSILCVVSSEMDLLTIEKAKKYKGIYFILGGTISGLRKKDIEKLRIEKLINKIKNSHQIKEVILALNPNTEGQTTALYLERKLKPLNKKITRLGVGLPIGGELEYADEETLSLALENRKEI